MQQTWCQPPPPLPPLLVFFSSLCGLAVDEANGWQISLEHEWRHIANRGDTVADDGTHTQAAHAAVCDYREMGLRIKVNRLQNKGKGEKRAWGWGGGGGGGITLWKWSILYRRISLTFQRESQRGEFCIIQNPSVLKGDARKGLDERKTYIFTDVQSSQQEGYGFEPPPPPPAQAD